MRVWWILVAVGTFSCVGDRRDKTTPTDAGVTATAASAPIGFAKMEADGTIVLDLTARGGGAIGHARKTYAPSHPDYRKVLDHVGGLQPGETKPVPPWPDPWDAARVEAAARDHATRVKGWPAGSYQLEITGTDAEGNAVVRLAREKQSVQVRVSPTSYTVVREVATP